MKFASFRRCQTSSSGLSLANSLNLYVIPKLVRSTQLLFKLFDLLQNSNRHSFLLLQFQFQFKTFCDLQDSVLNTTTFQTFPSISKPQRSFNPTSSISISIQFNFNFVSANYFLFQFKNGLYKLVKMQFVGSNGRWSYKTTNQQCKTSHKFYIASDFKEAIRQKGALKLYNEIFQSYLLSLQEVDIRAEDVNYPSDLSDCFAVYVPNEAEGPLPKGFIIGWLILEVFCIKYSECLPISFITK